MKDYQFVVVESFNKKPNVHYINIGHTEKLYAISNWFNLQFKSILLFDIDNTKPLISLFLNKCEYFIPQTSK